MKQPIQSDAFRDATLRSERFRTIGLLVIVGGFILLDLARMIFGSHRAAEILRFCEYIGFWLICGFYEGFMLFLIIRAQRRGRQTRRWVPYVNTFIECLFPSIAMLGLTLDKSYLGPYLALTSGNLIVYCLFIILSTLRLNPALCILAGVVTCGGYVGVYLLTLWGAPHNANRAVFPPESFVMSALELMIAGLLAAAVARQIKQHVLAALKEAETKHRLEQMEHDLETARSIQMGLLPKKPPSVPRYDIAGWSQPADQTGGDYYDWMELPAENGRRKIMFVIADATGHGIGPALLVAACRAYFRALVNHRDPLESITAQVDALLAADVPVGRFITAAIALLDPENDELSLYSAGHAPLYFYRATDHSVEAFESDQPPLGLGMPAAASDPPSRARVLKLADGDALVLVTDGFFEYANTAGELFGMERLGDCIRQRRDLCAASMIRELHGDVLAFARASAQGDDMTAVVIKRETAAPAGAGRTRAGESAGIMPANA